MNSVCLVGRLTRDPELRTTNSGISNCRFSLAAPDKPGPDGNPRTNFINIVTWRSQADNVAKYCKKGSMVGITGRIVTGSYQADDGSTRYTFEVVAESVRFLSSKKDGESTAVENNNAEDFNPNEVVLSDDDLPF